jgi:hypothetical protein
MWRFSGLLLAGGLLSAPAMAQAVNVGEALLESAYESHELEEAYEFGPPPEQRTRPWTIALWAPASWRSNRALASTGPQAAVAIEPEWSAARRWGTGRLAFFVEGGLFLSAMLPEPALDSSGWWGTAEISLDSPASGLSPYVAYEPRGIYTAVFQREIVTFHNLTLGVRRSWGPTALNLFVRRMQADRDIADQYQLAAHAQHTLPLGSDLALNLRGDAEWRSFDRVDGNRRRDIRARLRTRLFVPLDPAVDLALTVDVQRHWSTVDRFQFTNIIVGPALSARFRL